MECLRQSVRGNEMPMVLAVVPRRPVPRAVRRENRLRLSRQILNLSFWTSPHHPVHCPWTLLPKLRPRHCGRANPTFSLPLERALDYEPSGLSGQRTVVHAQTAGTIFQTSGRLPSQIRMLRNQVVQDLRVLAPT